jgi:hypothetical protein
MKNYLLMLTIGTAALITAGCVSTTIVKKNSPPLETTAQGVQSNIATPQMSPDVNFKASSAMPGGPGM